MKKETTGVILLNMGGPEKLEDVRPFLFNLFSDRSIIRLGPPLLQKPIAWYISRKRAPKSEKTYALIGGGSPLRKITELQASGLEKALLPEGNYRVVTAMRYWNPRAGEVLKELQNEGIEKLIAISLYPHYSKATTGSSMADLRLAIANSGHNFSLKVVESWPAHPLYIQCLAENIKKGIESFNGDSVHIVYSAHSLPVSFIQEGDPYLNHLELTVACIEEITGIKGILCFQSRSGPVEWLAPSTPETIEKIAAQGGKNILMVPLSFVSDHVETLYEIDMLYKEQASNLGIRLESSASLNTNPTFIQCLKDLVVNGV